MHACMLIMQYAVIRVLIKINRLLKEIDQADTQKQTFQGIYCQAGKRFLRHIVIWHIHFILFE